MHDIQPLEMPLWVAAVERLRARWRTHPRDDLEAQIRLASYLVQLAPEPARSRLQLDATEDEFERLLEDGELDAAVCLLTASMAEPPRFGREERAQRTVRRPKLSLVSSGGNADAFTLFGAWLEWMDHLATTAVTEMDCAGARSRRSAPGLRLVE